MTESAPSTNHPLAMSIDVEDWFHSETFHSIYSHEEWAGIPMRIEGNVHRILEHLDRFGIKATFFVLSWVAERNPALVRTMVEAGHEIASHGCDHRMVSTMTPEVFRADADRSKKVLEDLTGRPVEGYRAPSFSITDWAIPILQEVGYRYDSSFFPVVYHDRYGRIQAPGNGASIFQAAPGFFEVPLSTIKMAGRQFPWSGGGYFRLSPYGIFKPGIDRALRENGYYIFYFHPWEIDPQQPRIKKLSWANRFRHYNHLADMEQKVVRLLGDYDWTTVGSLLTRLGATAK